MRKGVTIFLGVMVTALMLTSFLSAVNSEIIIAKNAALVVTSKPVIASDTTLSELEPATYDAMIDSYHTDNYAVIPESEQNSTLPERSEAEPEPAMPAVSDIQEPERNTTVALANEPDAENSNETLPPAASDEAGIIDTTVAVTNTASTMQAHDSAKTIETEALPGQDRPAPLYAAVEIDNDNVIDPGPSGTAESTTVFTVQAGSFNNRFKAEDKYRSIIHDMNAADLDNLRIEKVGNYYAVRLGRFDHYVTAMNFLNAMNSKVSSAIVLKAYIKNERIVALHNNALLAGK